MTNDCSLKGNNMGKRNHMTDQNYTFEVKSFHSVILKVLELYFTVVYDLIITLILCVLLLVNKKRDKFGYFTNLGKDLFTVPVPTQNHTNAHTQTLSALVEIVDTLLHVPAFIVYRLEIVIRCGANSNQMAGSGSKG